ncbi:Mis12 protein-domain-containing protein [Coniochaeta sp. 2T2.1]|nr:Mis12 protein-domain-containing protein [Coniochaeta sp. 2T2.1]
MAESDIALLTEHFGYPPVSLLDEIINSINVLADRALSSVEKGLINTTPQGLGFKQPTAPAAPQKPTHSSRNATTNPTPDPSSSIVLSPEEAARHEIENGTHQLETLLCSSIDRNFDKFELYVMQNILCIRPSEPREWIRLGHYEGLDLEHATTTTSADDESQDGRPSLSGVRRLRRRLQASQQLNAILHAEKARNDALLEALRGVVGGPAALEKKSAEEEGKNTPAAEPAKMEVDGERVDLRADLKPPFGFLHDAGGLAAGASDKPLETTTAFTLSQLQALRALSTSLRNIMPDLETPRDEEEEDDGGRKSWRRQRMEYVETATRKHLEQARGLELGKDGEVRDGEWQGEGRRLAKDEVEGLEKVVAMLGCAGPAAAGASNEDAMDES